MTPVYCLVDCRDKISSEWELVAGIKASNMSEIEELIANYHAENFDISEYRLRQCERVKFYSKQPIIVLIAPSLKGKVA